jgi:excisionase family DNA binding protein
MEKKYITLKDLSYRLGLSGNYLRDLAKDGKIPSLNVNGRLRFNLDAVQRALNGLAAKRDQ